MFPNFALLLLFNTTGEILLLRRINTPFCNLCYSLPGGSITLGKTATTSVVAEAKKSLNIDIHPENLLFKHIMYRKCNDPEFFACFFQILSWQGECINSTPETYDDLAWFSLDALPEKMVPAHRAALEAIKKDILYSEHGWNNQSQITHHNKEQSCQNFFATN